MNQRVIRFLAKGAGLALGVLLSLAFESASSAAVLQVQVVNGAGRTQTGVSVIKNGAYNNRSIADGRVTLSVNPGDVLNFTRGTSSDEPGCAAPEGFPGVTYVVPSPVPTGIVSVGLPTMIAPSSFAKAAAPTQNERKLVGLINADRAEMGAAPVRISTALGAVAHHQGRQFDTNGNSFDCRKLDDTSHVVVDSGWTLGATSVVVYGYYMGPLSAYDNFDKRYVLASNVETVGVAQEGETWTIVVSVDCQEASCLVTPDTGSPPNSGSSAPCLNAKKKLVRAKRSLRRLKERDAAPAKVRGASRKVKGAKQKLRRCRRGV